MSNYYVAMDTETGGLNCKKADLLTAYFAILDEKYNVIDELYLKLKPDGRLPIAEAGALKVNGINIQQHLADPETVIYAEGKRLLKTLLNKYLSKYRGKSNLRPMVYNLPFDKPWISEYLLDEGDWEDLFHYKFVDPMQNIDFLKDCGWLPSTIGTLTSVVEYFGIPKRPAHNAKEDTLMMVDVHKETIKLMNSKKEGGQSQDLISLLEAE